MPRARRISARASVPLPTPTACGAPDAAANSCSNASTSGPSTNQARSMTRPMASWTAADSSAEVKIHEGDSNAHATRRRGLVVEVFARMGAVVVERLRKAGAQTHPRLPADRGAEARRIGVEAADVDRLLFGGHGTWRTDPAPATSISSATRSLCDMGSDPPTLKICPLHASDAPARRNASAASSTYTKSRICEPSPKIWISRPRARGV